jgi:hypothetical protein
MSRFERIFPGLEIKGLLSVYIRYSSVYTLCITLKVPEDKGYSDLGGGTVTTQILFRTCSLAPT